MDPGYIATAIPGYIAPGYIVSYTWLYSQLYLAIWPIGYIAISGYIMHVGRVPRPT